MAKTKLIQTDTDWMDIVTNVPPPEVHLLLYGCVRKELDPEQPPIALMGYWSDRLKVFIDTHNSECLSELFDIGSYHVVSDPDTGKPIPVFVTKMD